MDENLFNEFDEKEQWRIARLKEKQGIRRLSNAIGFAYGGVLAISVGWYSVAVILAGIFGVSATKFQEFVANPAISCFLQIVLSILFFILPFSLLLKIGDFDAREILPFNKPEKSLTLPLVLMGVGACAFSNIANNISGSIFISLGFPDKYFESEYPLGVFGVALAFISTAVVPALVEEFGMRGVCLGTLRRYGDGFAIVCSSLLFGFIHGNFSQIAFAAIIGVAAGYATVKSGSIWPAVIIHFINNFISVLVYYLSIWLGVTAANIIYMIILAFSLFLGVLGMVMISKHTENNLEVEENKTVSTFKDKFIWFLTSPVIIICILLSIAEAIFLR